MGNQTARGFCVLFSFYFPLKVAGGHVHSSLGNSWPPPLNDRPESWGLFSSYCHVITLIKSLSTTFLQHFLLCGILCSWWLRLRLVTLVQKLWFSPVVALACSRRSDCGDGAKRCDHWWSALHYLNAWKRLWLPWYCLLFSLWDSSFFFLTPCDTRHFLTGLNNPSVSFSCYLWLSRAFFIRMNNNFYGPLALSDLRLLWSIIKISFICVLSFTGKTRSSAKSCSFSGCKTCQTS